MNNANTSIYDADFYQRHTQDAIESARIIVPILLKLIQPKSVIDVGCGLGAWLKVFTECGVKGMRGLDGNHIDQKKLLVDPTCFTAVDLTTPLNIEERYDLVVCLEVAEHLPDGAAPSLIRALTSLAPLVLFSAAIPGQDGQKHINEQWPSYWKALFAEHAFQRLDPIRRHIWRDDRIQWWYRQNLFLYASQDAIAQSAELQEEEKVAELDIVYIDFLNRYKTMRGVLGELPRVIRNAVRRRVYQQFY
jgi:2-polyprenyl-3-methyl-5-hydroxy-6-metoxy-1,4-benzoquinol methylase